MNLYPCGEEDWNMVGGNNEQAAGPAPGVTRNAHLQA